MSTGLFTRWSTGAGCAALFLLLSAGCTTEYEYAAAPSPRYPTAPIAVEAVPAADVAIPPAAEVVTAPADAAPVVVAAPPAVVAATPGVVVLTAPLAPDLVTVADAQAHAAMPNGVRFRDAYAGVAYARKDFTDWMFPLEVGHCYAFGFAADPSVRKVKLTLFDPMRHRVDSERSLPPGGTLRHCPAQNGMYRLEARASGAGHMVVVAYSDAGPTVVVTPASVVVAAAPVVPPAPATVVLAPIAQAPQAHGPIVVSQSGSTVNVYTR